MRELMAKAGDMGLLAIEIQRKTVAWLDCHRLRCDDPPGAHRHRHLADRLLCERRHESLVLPKAASGEWTVRIASPSRARVLTPSLPAPRR